MNRIKVIWEMLRYLLSNNYRYVSRAEISLELSNLLEEDIPVSRVKQYIKDIRDSFDYNVDFKAGPEGGYKLSKELTRDISQFATLSLTREERNALNDSFEIALRSTNFHYKTDLEDAKKHLYSKSNWKDQDFEYYVGVSEEDKEITRKLKLIKDAAIEHKRVKLSSKYEYFGIPKELTTYKPLYIIHDPDESFIVLKDKDGKYHYQNLLNIDEVIVKDDHFDLSQKEEIEDHTNTHTISIKEHYELEFEILTERGHSIFNLWNYEFEDLSKDKKYNKKIKFFEQYKCLEFLLRTQRHIKIIKINKTIKEKWNKILSELKTI